MNHTRNNDRLTVAGHLIRRPASLAVRLRMETVMSVKWLAVIADGDTGICELPFVSPTESGSERRVNMTISRTAPLSAQPAGRAGSTTKVCKVKNRPLSNLNQLASREVPALVDVLGVSLVTNTVTVNGQPAYRKAEYFRQQLAADNSASSLWFNLIVAATGQTRVTGNVYVAQSPEQFSYDPDGNLTNDGRWAYTWDAENRLVTMTVNTNVGPQYQLAFAYDPKGRRIQKTVATNGVAVSTNKFLYDGWNLVAELQPNNAPIRSYVWGNDLSGSQQGAGGVGGLLEVSCYGTTTTNCFPAYDGNGNVAALINAADGTIAANYEYGPFGEVIRQTGPMAKVNPFRFSTKYQDDESDLLYYGYRYYKASTGTWPNRDPLREKGGMNLYVFVRNFPSGLIDAYGNKGISVPIGFPGLSTGGGVDGLISKVSDKVGCKDCVYNLYIAAHGNPDVVLLTPDASNNTGNTGGIDRIDANNVSTVFTYIKDRVNFCKECHIYLLSCNTGLGSLPAAIKAATGCTVHAPMNYVFPDENDPRNSPVHDDPHYAPYPGHEDKFKVF
jgi:RHS repeat-associated protein